MAQAIIGAIAASTAGSALGAGIQVGGEAALQSQRYQQNLQLQENSFKHDKEMIGYQVEAIIGAVQAYLLPSWQFPQASIDRT